MRVRRTARWVSLLPLPIILSVAELTSAATGPVTVAQLEGVISPGTTGFFASALQEASARDSECLILVLDTPGGLETSMRAMVTAILNSPIPVVVYVAPAGARAASAGAFITLAAHVAAMAPGTNIGAAHPVNLGAPAGDEEMAKKAANDAAAFMRSIAQRRGRNEDWAERAVRESISSSAEEAVREKVVDFVAPTREALLDSLEGRRVTVGESEWVLAVKGRPVKEIAMGFRHRMRALLSDPNAAYIFLILGFYGLLFELSNPGAILPGVVGGIFIILAFYALHTLPVNYAGLLLILFAMVLFVAEIKVTSYGLLAVGGVVSLLLGSLLLFDSPIPFLRVSWSVVLPIVLVSTAFFLFALTYSIRTHRRRPTTGQEGMIGLRGRALVELAPAGQVEVRGETWWAESEEPIRAGEEIEVVGLTGPLRLKVRRRV